MSKNRFRPVVGIDLGTTNSSVAVIRDGQAELVDLEKGTPLLPSVVYISKDDEVIVGEDARAALLVMPERTVAEVKREMGRKEPVVIAGKNCYQKRYQL